MKGRSWMLIFWPSFLMAGATSALVFALIDPLDIAFFGHLHAGRQVVYAAGFFLFWSMAALSSALTIYMAPKFSVEQDEFQDG